MAVRSIPTRENVPSGVFTSAMPIERARWGRAGSFAARVFLLRHQQGVRCRTDHDRCRIKDGRPERQSSSTSRVWRRNAMTAASMSSVRTLDRGCFGRVFMSSTVARLRHAATVFRLIPGSPSNGACDRYGAPLIARAVVALAGRPRPIPQARLARSSSGLGLVTHAGAERQRLYRLAFSARSVRLQGRSASPRPLAFETGRLQAASPHGRFGEH